MTVISSDDWKYVWGLFGGVGGAVLTAGVNSWKARQERPAIYKSESTFDFALPFATSENIKLT